MVYAELGLVHFEPPQGARGHVKGSILLSRIAYVRERGGEDAFRELLDQLGLDDRIIVSGIVLPISWYPFEVSDALDLAICGLFGGGNDVYKSLGASSAKAALGTTHKNFVRAHDPHGLLCHVTQLHRLYKDTGEMTYEKTGDTSAVLRTYECASFSAADCLTNLGWHEAAIALCGGKSARARESKCRARSDGWCEYVCAWQ
jgi:hypothetical protein